MNLAEILYSMNQQSMSAAQLTDLKVGTVTSNDPLEISINPNMPPLRAQVLLLTAAVVEKKIPILTHLHNTGGLGHNHTVNGTQTTTDLTAAYPSDQQLDHIICYENSQPLPVENGYIILNRALEVGDQVILLRVERGQRFIVLSRVMEG